MGIARFPSTTGRKSFSRGRQSRFRWIVHPGNDIYFVVMNNWIDTANRMAVFDRSATVKISYTRRF